MRTGARAYTLVEVMVAGGILLAALVPLLSLIQTGSTQAVKARDRAVAAHLATAVFEDLAARPVPAEEPTPAPGWRRAVP